MKHLGCSRPAGRAGPRTALLAACLISCLAASCSGRGASSARDAAPARRDAADEEELTDYELRLAALRDGVAQGGAMALVMVRRDLEDPEPLIRATAAELAARLDPDDALPLLRHASRDPRAEVRIEAAIALDRVGTAEARDFLLAWGMTDPAPRVRFVTADTFVVRGDRAIVAALERELGRLDTPEFPHREVRALLGDLERRAAYNARLGDAGAGDGR